MKKLLLHIGFPKTATTTLQEAVFLKLHEQGVINFLGRTVKSTHTRFGKSNFSGVDWVVAIRKHFLFGKELPAQAITLSKDKLNVLSDEDLTIHGLFHTAQFGVERSPAKLAPILKKLTSDADEVILLMSVRNQVDLIKSCFIQKYKFVKNTFPHLGFHDFVTDVNGNINKSIEEVFDFNIIIENYTRVFGSKINILFFEDLKFDPKEYFEVLGDVMDIDALIIESLIKNEHFRKKASNENPAIKIAKPYLIGNIISKIIGTDKFRFFFERKNYMRNSILDGYLKRIFIRNEHVGVPEILQDDENRIFEFFQTRNLLFSKDQNIDVEKLKKYKYL